MSNEATKVTAEHLPGLLLAKQECRRYEDLQFLGFLIEKAEQAKADHNADECNRFAGELLPCPFCGCAAKADNGFAPAESIVYAWCSNNNCHLHSVELGFSPEQWNLRASLKAQPAVAENTGSLNTEQTPIGVETVCLSVDGVAAPDEAELADDTRQARAAQPAPVVPEGWSARLIKDGDAAGYVVSTPQDEAGVRSNTSVWADDDDPAHAMLWHMLAAAPAQGRQVECQECERLRGDFEELAERYGKLQAGEDSLLAKVVTERDQARAELAALKAQQAEDSDTVRRICDLFGIGSKARTQSAIMANVENTHEFARMLDAIEAEFFMVPGEIDPEYPDDQPYDCLVNRWGSTPEQYVEQFRAALETLKAQQVGQEPACHRLRNCLGEVITEWQDGPPPEQITDICGVVQTDVTVEVAYITPQPAPAQDVAGSIMLSQEGAKILAEAIGAHAYVLGALVNGRPDLAMNEAKKWVDGFMDAGVAVTAHDKQSGGEV